MYGRNSSNIFTRNTSTNSSSTGNNIFTRTNQNASNNSNSNSSYGNTNNNKFGSYRLPGYSATTSSRVMQEINPKWRSNELNPASIYTRPQVMHMVPRELRIEDYYLIRKQRLERDQEKLLQNAIDKDCFYKELGTCSGVQNLKEPLTFRDGEVGLDILKEMNKNRALIYKSSTMGNSINSNSNNSSSGNNNIFSSSNNNNSNNSSIFNRNTTNNNNSSSGNIFSGNNNNNNNNSSSNNNNIFSGNSNSNNTNRNIFGTNNNSSTNNNNIFSSSNNNNNNSSGSRNIFANSSSNNSNNIFSNTNNNSNNSNTNRGIFGNNSSNNNSSNIFSGNSNNNNNTSNTNRNIFGNNNNSNNSGGSNIFSNNNNNSGGSRNIFGNNSSNNNSSGGNNIFNNNNNGNNNNGSRNIFGNNGNNNSNNNGSRNIFGNNNSNGNNIFSNSNSNGYNQNSNLSPMGEFGLMKMIENTNLMIYSFMQSHQSLAERLGVKGNGAMNGINGMGGMGGNLYGENNGGNGGLLQWGSNGGSTLGSSSVNGSSLNGNRGSNMMANNHTIGGNGNYNNNTSVTQPPYPSILSLIVPEPTPPGPLESYDFFSSSNETNSSFQTTSMYPTVPNKNPYFSSYNRPKIVFEPKSREEAEQLIGYPVQEEDFKNQKESLFKKAIHRGMGNFREQVLSKGSESLMNQRESSHQGSNKLSNGDKSFYKTKSEYIPEGQMQMRQLYRVEEYPEQEQSSRDIHNLYGGNSYSNKSSIHNNNNNNNNNNLNNSNNFNRYSQNLSNQSREQQFPRRKINLPEGYVYKPKHFQGNIVSNLQITNEYGTVRWSGQIDISGIDFSRNFAIFPDRVQCSIPQLDRECYLTFYTIPTELQDLDQKQAFNYLFDYLKKLTNDNVELQMFLLNPPQYRLKVKRLCGKEGMYLDDQRHRRLESLEKNQQK